MILLILILLILFDTDTVYFYARLLICFGLLVLYKYFHWKVFLQMFIMGIPGRSGRNRLSTIQSNFSKEDKVHPNIRSEVFWGKAVRDHSFSTDAKLSFTSIFHLQKLTLLTYWYAHIPKRLTPSVKFVNFSEKHLSTASF